MTTGNLVALLVAGVVLWGLLLRAYRRGHR